MANSSPLVLRLLAASASVSRHAGSIIRNISTKKDVGVVLKGGRVDDPQTEADRQAQRCIISSLKHQFPTVTIIGEEDIDGGCDETLLHTGLDEEVLKCSLPEGLHSDGSDVVVWVDPLDGTSEFTAGFWDNVTVLIGIAVKGEAACGVIHQPFFGMSPDNPTPSSSAGRTCWGITGVGSFGYTYTAPSNPARRSIASTRTHSTGHVKDTIEALKPTEQVNVGGAGCKVLMLLEGRADVYAFASPGTSKWDTCAGQAMLEAVGGHLTDIAGNKYRYTADVTLKNTRGVLASLNADHKELVDLVPDSVKQALSK
eukprot:scpid9364/ scgid28152/ 3&apos; Bisphosphate 3&apos; PAP-inositol 1,4-phosphatase